jgi:arylsulfatase A-like enzyme
VTLLLLAASTCGPPAPEDLSVVLVTLDTTRADRLGPYGGPAGLTPAFDGLARSGVLFQQAQAQSAVTPVAHASLFTAQNPYRHGLRTLHGNRLYQLPEEAVTLAERFRERGYETAGFIAAFPCSRRFGLAQGFDVYDESFPERGRPRVSASGSVNTGLAQRDAAATTDAALGWLRHRRGGRPFFLWVHYFDPHDPLLRPPPSFTEPFMEGFPEHQKMEMLLANDMGGFVMKYAQRPEIMQPWLRRLYDAEVAYADSQLGRLVQELGGLGLADRTVLAVTADHGEGLGDHDWWGHGILYQEQIHVPLALAGPGLPAGVAVPDRVRHIDVAPTLLELATGAGFSRGMDGRSLLPLMAARAAGRTPPDGSLPGPAYADSVTLMRYGAIFSQGVTDEKDDQLYAWIAGDLKWIRHRLRPEESELYDLAADPDELVNLLAARPEDAARLDASLEERRPMTDGIDFSLPGDREVREKLRSLGYVD